MMINKAKSCKTYDQPYVFISYCHEDSDEVLKILDVMQQNHFRFWYDDGLHTGTEWSDEIAKRIKNCKQFIVFISEKSVLSENVKNEIHMAFTRGRHILRIHLDRTELSDGLELNLSRFHALLKYKYGDQEFLENLCAVIDKSTIDPFPVVAHIAETELKMKYALLHQIGSGGTGSVYLARDLHTGGTVAVKHGTIDTSLIGQALKTAYDTEKSVLIKQLSCYTPTIIDFYSDASNIYLVESLVQGIPLSELPLSGERQVIEIILKVARILKQYHNGGVVYCDLKPQHIICNNEACFLIDFGACWQTDYSNLQQRIMGTPGYAAPEQYCSYNGDSDVYGESTRRLSHSTEKIDCRTDIYSLGQVLYKVLADLNTPASVRRSKASATMRTTIGGLIRTFNTMDTAILLNQKTNHPNDSGLEPRINPLLGAIIDKMTRERKSERFGSMDEVIDALEGYCKILSA